jgi:hypothetical protein
MPAWTPTCDTYAFNEDNPAHTFHSCYIAGQRYDVMPYVYSGFDTPAEFLQRIENGVCPGGWDRRSPLPAELPRRHTRYWSNLPPVGLDYRTRVLDNLAGIDSSGFVLRCWGFDKRRINGRLYRTINMASLCVPVTREKLQAGDLLLWPDHHARLFHQHRAGLANVFEAYGGEGLPRVYMPGDLMGCVIHRDVEWEDASVAYSPFPQLRAFQVAAGSTIEAEFVGSGELALVECMLDGIPIPYRTTSASPLRVEHTPENALTGRHGVRMTVVNRVAGHEFQDTFVRQFDWS